jgi:hypothetical protein
MAYLHCPSCHRSAWLGDAAPHGARCRRCDAALTAVVGAAADPLLTAAVRARFGRDMRLDAGRGRFVRGSGPHRVAE